MDGYVDKIGKKDNKIKNWKLIPLFIMGFIVLFSYYFLSAPYDNKDIIFHISTGKSIDTISQELKNNRVIRSDFAFKIFVKLLKSGRGVVSGDYLIKKNSPIWVVAWQVSRGHHNIEPIRITIREGLTNEEIATLLSNKLPSFQKDLFLTKTLDKQGYLFPDTYFFFPLDTLDEIIQKLSNNFNYRTKNIIENLDSKKLSDIIIMASILEGEAKGKEDNDIISGILWKRILLEMPLQVDVDKRTYINKGLPTKPLNNPGLVSIEAALNPTQSSYLYYLHDKNGNVHYATTFKDHKKNINNYLK